MRIKIAESKGCPAPQFVVIAETDQERAILKIFCHINDYSNKHWKFYFHGCTYEQGIESAFNFGWTEDEAKISNAVTEKDWSAS
jgi:hypothetical protein